MDAGSVVGLARDALWVVLLVGGPLLFVSTLVGLVMGVLQATTQISEPSLLFVPKLCALLVVALLAGPWMLAQLAGYAARLLSELPRFAR